MSARTPRAHDAPFTWLVAVTVAPELVADGIDISDEDAALAFCRRYPLVLSSELTVRVVKAPAPSRIAKAQGK